MVRPRLLASRLFLLLALFPLDPLCPPSLSLPLPLTSLLPPSLLCFLFLPFVLRTPTFRPVTQLCTRRGCGAAMEKKKRRAYRESEGDDHATATVSLDIAPLPPLSPPRKRAASLACPAPAAAPPPDDAEVFRTSVSDARGSMDGPKASGPAIQDLDEPVLWPGNPIAAASSPDTAVELQRDGDADSNKAMIWSLEQNLPKEAFLPRLLKAYESFHDRYTRMKARKVDIETQFEEQRRSHERFQQVADGYIQDLCSENQELRKTVEADERRIKWLESLLCQKGEFRACSGSKEDVLQKADCEAAVAASPVRPLIPTADKLATEGAPVQAELHLPSEHPREQRGVEVAECCVESSVPQENCENQVNERPREIEMGLDDEEPQQVVETRESDGPQILTENVVPRENVLIEGGVEPSRLEGEQHFASTQTSERTIFATNQVPGSPVAEPLLANSLENARCQEHSAPADLEMAIVDCAEPILTCPPNEIGFQDAHRHSAELQDLHCKYAELRDWHQKEVAGLQSEVVILQKILGHFIDMNVVSDKLGRTRRDKPTLTLLHPKTGFRFRLEILEEHEVQVEVAKVPELSYQNLSLGTLIGVAPWWMKEEIVFTVDQLVNFLRKFYETLTGIPYNQRLALDFGFKF